MEFEKLRSIICNVLDLEESDVTMESKFVDDLNADSLDFVEIIVEIEATFDLVFDDEAAADIVTVADAVEKIKAAIA